MKVRLKRCKELRELTKAPLKLCLEALDRNELDVKSATKWLFEEYNIAKSSDKHTFFKGVIVSRNDGKEVFFLSTASDIILNSEIMKNLLINICKYPQDVNDLISRTMLQSSDSIELIKHLKLGNNYQFYAHRNDGINIDTFQGGCVFFTEGDLEIGCELHWGLKVKGNQGKVYDLNYQEIIERLGETLTINGTSKIRDILPKTIEVIVFD